MSSAAYALPLRLERRYSRALARTVIIVHASALAVLAILDLPWWLKSTLAVAVLIQAVITWRRHVNVTAPGAIRAIVWRADGQWELSDADGKTHAAQLRRASYVQPALVVLRFKLGKYRRRAVLLPVDGVDADLHRRLRVGLRLHAELA